MAATADADAKRHRLTTLLRVLQQEKNFTTTSAGAAAGRSQSYWSKVMTGMVLPKREQMEAFLDAVEPVDPDVRAEILRIVDDLEQASADRRIMVTPLHSRNWNMTLQKEARAGQICYMATQNLPDLLRTNAFHRHVIRSLTEREQRSSLDELNVRQVSLGDRQKERVFLLDESAILRFANKPAEIEWGQLCHLIDLVHAKVPIGMVPLDADVAAEPMSYRLVDQAFVVVDIDMKGHVVLRDQKSIDLYDSHFRAMRDASITGNELARYLHQRAKRLGVEVQA